MPDPSLEKERDVAELAVLRASRLTERVFRESAKGTLSKDDKSPVTIGDYGAQALIIKAIRTRFPQDQIVAEEESSALRESADLRDSVWRQILAIDAPGDGLSEQIGGAITDQAEMVHLIDLGGSDGGGKGRVWTLDPIDGTKGFIRGRQYVIALALIVDGEVAVGAIAAPNLSLTAPVDADMATYSREKEAGTRGVIASAIRAQGARYRSLSPGGDAAQYQRASVPALPHAAAAVLLEGVEPSHSSHDEHALIARELDITQPPVRLDSQAKYVALALGLGSIYLRLQVSADYEEKIWDHAAGDIIVREAGGQVSDVRGNRLDFSVGRTLQRNAGIVAAPKGIHDEVIRAVQHVLGRKNG